MNSQEKFAPTKPDFHSKLWGNGQNPQPGTFQSSVQCLCLSECIYKGKMCQLRALGQEQHSCHQERMLPRVYQAIQHLCCLFYKIRLVWVVFKLVIRLQVQNHVQSLSIVRDLFIQASKVELVLNVVLVHLAEELVSTQTAEPRDPGYLLQK